MTDVQARVQNVLHELIDRGEEGGLQVAAYLGDELVVDAWAGLADGTTGRLVDGETLFTVFSTTKGIAATAVHLLADRGLLDYDAPIATYWPEFGTVGKERVTARHVLTHTAGLPQMPDGAGPAEICDWQGICRAIAGLRPLWAPGSRIGYHALTYGWLLGEVVRRIDGRRFARFVQEEIAAPLGITSLFLGITDKEEPRVARLDGPPQVTPPPPPSPDDLTPEALDWRSVPPTLRPLAQVFSRPDVRRACVPGGGGIMNARAIARHYAALANGELNGVRLLTPEGLCRASSVQVAELDETGASHRRALGYMLGGPSSPMGDRISAFGHAGYGGSLGFADPPQRFAFGLAKTRMVEAPVGEETAHRLCREIRQTLGLPATDLTT